MKFQFILAISAIFAAALISSCQNDGSSDANKLAGEENAQPAGAFPGDAAAPGAGAPMAEPAQNAAGLWHYTCPKGCTGGAGSAVACTQCGTTLTHSQAYHGTPTATTTTTSSSPTISANPAEGVNPPPITMPNAGKSEPPQNAAGVWHYTCPSGCSGGAGSATPCATCSKTLVHNTAYHGK